MRRQCIAHLDEQPAGFVTTTKPYTHAVACVFANSGRTEILAWCEDEVAAQRKLKHWKGFPGYRKVVVVPVASYPVRERAS